MKRYIALGMAMAGLLLLVWQWRSHHESASAKPDSTAVAVAVANPLENAQSVSNEPKEVRTEDANLVPVATNQLSDERSEELRVFYESPDLPVELHGMVVNQDSNALRNVKVDFRVIQWDPTAPPGAELQRTNVASETGVDGRFELSGVKGHIVKVIGFTKDGYEPEFMRPIYGEYGPKAGSFEQPIVFCLWSTDLHEPLITGDRMFKIIPDGRHYGIDLTKGTIAESEEGDLVVWIKRPESAQSTQKFAWSCGMVAPGGGFQPEGSRSQMYRAPVGEYTNVFTFNVEYNTPARDGMSLDNRFYFRLRSGLYGRLSANFWTIYHNWPSYSTDPAFGQIHISYAINPSGSRILREQVLVPTSQGSDAPKFPAQLTWPPR